MKTGRGKPRGEAKLSLSSLPDCGAVILDFPWTLVTLTEEGEITLISF